MKCDNLIRISGLILCLVPVYVSCSFLHDDQVVAKVGRRKLYRSEVVKFIPPGISAGDSLKMAGQYINAWAGRLVIDELAARRLSKEEQDVSMELEDYRNSLLKYRFEQKYVADNLDTCVTDAQIAAHYEANSSIYILEKPLLKGRYLRIQSTSPVREELKELLVSNDAADIARLDSLSYSNAEKYVDYGDDWTEIAVLSGELGAESGKLSELKKGAVVDVVDKRGAEHIIYAVDYVKAGCVAPLEYCRNAVRNSILGKRKHDLSSSLEHNVLEEARQNGYFVIYDDEKE